MKKAAPLMFLALAMAALGGFASMANAQRQRPRTAEQVIHDSELYRASTAADVEYASGRGTTVLGLRCGVAPLTLQEQEAIEERARPLLQARAFGLAAATEDDKIDVWVHVVHDGKNGLVPDRDVIKQIKVLNRAFKKHGIEFELAGITKTKKRSWFRKCGTWNPYRKMTDKLAVDPSRNLNIYTCDPGGVLGLVWDLPGGPTGITGTAQDGVVALYSSLPNGTAAPYDEGDTVTHEVGHWAGLYHTFESRCNAPGDRVDDTPPESSPAFGCPQGRDTCSDAGRDPIRNFMDYSDDACMRKFSNGQGARIRERLELFRPNV